MDIPLGIRAADYNSKKQKGLLVNMIADVNREGDYITVRRLPGLSAYDSSLSVPIRSNFHKNGDFFYFVSGFNLYRFSTGAPINLGAVGGLGRATILSNSVPGDNQILVLNGSGDAYIYDSGGLNQVTDPDYASSTSAAILNERFWFVEDGTNTLFASDVSDGTSYNALSFLNAEWKPDNVVIAVSVGSSLWGIGTETMEYFQSVDDDLVPIRAVRGYSQEIGILAKTSFSQLDNYFAFLANDSTAVLVDGTNVVKISDIDFENRVFGDGTTRNPGFTDAQIQDCQGFWVETPQHKIFYLSFPSADYTWGYDVSTGVPHTRESYDGQAWRGLHSILDNNTVYMGDRINGNIWNLKPETKSEGSDPLVAVLRFPSISFRTDATIPKVEIDCEVAVAESVGENPRMMCRYSKDGGSTWINHPGESLGGWGEHDARVVLRHFGRVVRNKDFILELRVSDAVRFQVYAARAKEELCI